MNKFFFKIMTNGKTVQWRVNEEFLRENRTLHSLGYGGFAQVYETENCLSLQRYAIKLANRKCKSFDTEVIVMQKLKNLSGFLQIVDYFLINHLEPNSFAIVMGCLPGRDFFNFCEENMSKVIDKTIDRKTTNLIDHMLLSTLESVTTLHKLDIAHRDIKPENLRIVDEIAGKIVLMDYGLSCYFDGIMPNCDLQKIVGTTCYTIPRDLIENIITKQMIISADVYAVGMAFNLLVTGKTNCNCTTTNHASWETNLESFDRGPKKNSKPDDPHYISLVWEMIAPNAYERPTAATLVEELAKKLEEKK